MALYLISYDIKTDHEEQYAELRRMLIETLNAQCILDSVWLVEDEETDLAQYLADELCGIIKPGDGEGLIVAEVTNDIGFCKLRVKDDDVRTLREYARAGISQ